MSLMRALVVSGAFVALLAGSVPCAADDSLARHPRTSVALLSGYGFQLDSVLASGLSAYRFGFGTRAGVTLPFGGYVGGTFVTHVGTNVAGVRSGVTTYVGIAHDSYLGPEAGFDFELRKLLLRPYVGTGALVAFGKTVVRDASVSDNAVFFYVAPGGVVAYRLGDLLLGIDVRIPIVPAQSSNKWAPAALLTLGMTFGSRNP
jgi:hypothetical protein